LITIYRFPFLLKDIWTKQNATSITSHDEAMETAGNVTLQGWYLFLDLLCIVFLFIPLVVTIHRLPSLFRRLSAETYDNLIGNNSHQTILVEEFFKIGYCDPTEDEILIANIVEGSVEVDVN